MRNGILIIIFSLLSCRSGFEGFDPPISLDVDFMADGRIRVLSLPSSLTPDIETDEEKLLQFRSAGNLYSGLDAVALDDFSLLKKRKFGLLTNATGLDRNLTPGLDLMVSKGIRPSVLFEPEHGLYSHADEFLPGGLRLEARYRIPLLSLYSSIYKPDYKHLKNLDTIVIDIQNLPVRCYTYISTVTYLLEAAEKYGLEIIILDRPNPYGFWKARGPYLKKGFESFVGLAPVPYLYSMTPGEYSIYMALGKYSKLKLTVVKVRGYEREDSTVSLNRAWINPSPNIPNLESALVYAGMVFLEGTNLSAGRGTTRPFVYSGAPWMDSRAVADELKRLDLPGVRFATVVFTPTSSVYAHRVVKGIQFHPVETSFDPIRTAYEYIRIVRKLHPRHFYFRKRGNGFFMDHLWGDSSMREAIMADLDFQEFESTWSDDADEFERLTEDIRLY